MQVVRDADEWQEKQHVPVARIAVLPEDVQHPSRVLVSSHDAAIGAFSQEVEEAVGCVAVVAGEWEQ